ncbi:hypothetical protein ABPG74_006913 [Tetrahymena malaccensis]
MSKFFQSFSKYFQKLYRTALIMAEEKAQLKLDSRVFNLFILINSLQMCSYLFSNSIKQAEIVDSKLEFIAQLSQYAKGVFLLSKQGLGVLSIILLVGMFIVLLLITIYLIKLNNILHNENQSYKNYRQAIKRINKQIALFFITYQWILLIPLTDISLEMITSKKYSQNLNSPLQNQSYYQQQCFNRNVDVVLEELYQKYCNSYHSYKDKIEFFEIVSYHQKFCTNFQCACKVKEQLDNKFQIDKQFVHSLIENIFKQVLESPQYISIQDRREEIFIKYITFVSSILNNPLRAYCELRLYNKTYKEVNSFYYNVVSNLLSNQLESMIQKTQKSLYLDKAKQDLDKNLVLSIQEIVLTDKIERAFIRLSSKFISQKIIFLQSLKQQKMSFEKIKLSSINLFQQYNTFRNEMLIQQNLLKNKKEFQRNFILQKIQLVFGIVAHGEIKRSFKLQKEMNVLISQNIEKPQSELNSLNLIKGHIQIVQASITQGFGKIVNNNNNNFLAKFFGFNTQEFKSIEHIKQLMPQYIAQVHDELIKAFIIRGHSKFLEENHQVFCRNKQGFFVPITLQLTLVYGITDDLQMNAVLLKLDSNISYITFNSVGDIIGFNINFFNHIFGLESSVQVLDQEQACLKKHIESLNIFILMPRLAKIVLKFLQSINQNINIEQTGPIIQKQQICKQKKLNLYLLQDLLELDKNSQFQKIINIDQHKNTNQAKFNNNQLSFLEHQIQLVSQFIDFYKSNIEKWQEMNCYSTFQGLANLIVNKIKQSRKLITGNLTEEYVFELTLSDIQIGGFENLKKYGQISRQQRFQELNFLRLFSQEMTTQRDQFQSPSVFSKNQDDLYIIKKTNSLNSYECTQESQYDDQLEQKKQLPNKNNNYYEQNESLKNKQLQKQNNDEKHLQYKESQFKDQYNNENSMITSEYLLMQQAQITECQYQNFNTKQSFQNNQKTYNDDCKNSIYTMKNQMGEQQFNEDDKQNEQDNQIVKANHQEILEQKISKFQPYQKIKRMSQVQQHFLSQQQTQAISSKYHQETSKIESENQIQDDINQIQETNSNFEAYKENQIINSIIFQKLTIGSQINHFLLGKFIQIYIKIIANQLLEIGCSFLIFTAISTGILLYIFSKLDSFSKNLYITEIYSTFYEYISQFSLTQQLAYEKYLNIQLNLQYDQIYSVNQTQCQNLIQSYMENLQQIILSINIDEYIDSYIYTLGEGKSRKLSFVNFWYQNVNSMVQVSDYQKIQEQGIIYKNNLYILLANMLENYQISNNGIQQITQNQNNLMSQINNSFIVSIFIIIAIIITFLVFAIPVIRKINNFQEYYLNKIQNDDKQWIQYDFLNAHKKDLDELRHHYEKTTSFISTKRKTQKNNPNNQKLISSQLVQTSLKKMNYFFLFVLFCLSYVAFISIALGVSYKYQNEIKQRFSLYQYNINNLQKFQTILVLSESALRIDIIKSKDGLFPNQNQDEIKNTFLSSIQDLNQFLIKINDYTQTTSFLDMIEESKLQQILQADLCQDNKSELQCSEQSPVQRVFQQGFLAVLIHYCKYLQQSFDNVNINSNDYYQQIQYALSSEYPYIIPQGFNIPNISFKSLTSSSLSFLNNRIDQQKLFLLLYTLLGGFIMYFVWFGLSIKIKNIITLDLNAVKYVLTCIPLEKQQDENIIFMLKKIQKI